MDGEESFSLVSPLTKCFPVYVKVTCPMISSPEGRSRDRAQINPFPSEMQCNNIVVL